MKTPGLIAGLAIGGLIGIGGSQALEAVTSSGEKATVSASEGGCNVRENICQITFDVAVGGHVEQQKTFTAEMKLGTFRDRRGKLKGTPPVALLKFFEALKAGEMDSALKMAHE